MINVFGVFPNILVQSATPKNIHCGWQARLNHPGTVCVDNADICQKRIRD